MRLTEVICKIREFVAQMQICNKLYTLPKTAKYLRKFGCGEKQNAVSFFRYGVLLLLF